MTSITDLLLGNVDNITSTYVVNIAEPSKALLNLREDLLKKGHTVHKFDRQSSIEDKTLIAVDGGRVTDKLAGGDLIVVGATAGEGYRSKQLFASDEEIPAEAYSAIIPHTSQNQNVESGIMAALELRIFQKTEADMKIIDGAYLGNASQVLFSLISNDPATSNIILGLNNGDEDGLLRKALNTILYPDRNLKDYVAVAKSDSSFVFSKKILGESNPLSKKVSDRILANRILQRGELLQPRNLASNNNLITSLNRFVKTDYRKHSTHPELLHELIHDKAGLLTRLDAQNTEEGILWTTYFKPTAWSDYSPAIKVEFVYYPVANTSISEGALQRAREVVSLIDQDILDEAILEPWCQYAADRLAKNVSAGANLIKSYLLESAETPHEIDGLLKGYRS